MARYRLDVVYDGVDHDDDEVLEALESLEDVHWVFQAGVTHAIAFVTAGSVLDAAQRLLAAVERVAPSLQPRRLDRDLVSISDIAHRLGVSRETVRLWSTGARRQGAFPDPVGIVGDAIKVWAWGDVNQWLTVNLSLGDGYEHPDTRSAAEVDLLIGRFNVRHLHQWRSSLMSTFAIEIKNPSLGAPAIYEWIAASRQLNYYRVAFAGPLQAASVFPAHGIGRVQEAATSDPASASFELWEAELVG